MKDVGQSNTEELVEKLNQIQQNLNGALSKMCAEVENVFQAYIESIEEFEKSLSSEMMKILNKLVPLLQVAQKNGNEFLAQRFTKIADEGWFCDIGETEEEYSTFMKEVSFYHEISELSDAFKEYHHSHLELIEQRLLHMYPERNRFITEAFDAHRTGKYLFSIPVFLSL